MCWSPFLKDLWAVCLQFYKKEPWNIHSMEHLWVTAFAFIRKNKTSLTYSTPLLSKFFKLFQGREIKSFFTHCFVISQKLLIRLVGGLHNIQRGISGLIKFTCSKSAIETLETDLKFVQSNDKDNRTTSTMSFWCLFCYFWTYFANQKDILNKFYILFWCFHCWL